MKGRIFHLILKNIFKKLLDKRKNIQAKPWSSFSIKASGFYVCWKLLKKVGCEEGIMCWSETWVQDLTALLCSSTHPRAVRLLKAGKERKWLNFKSFLKIMKQLFNKEKILGISITYTFLLIHLKKAIPSSYLALIRCHQYFTSKWTIMIWERECRRPKLHMTVFLIINKAKPKPLKKSIPIFKWIFDGSNSLLKHWNWASIQILFSSALDSDGSLHWKL